jgi:hypothetical protein
LALFCVFGSMPMFQKWPCPELLHIEAGSGAADVVKQFALGRFSVLQFFAPGKIKHGNTAYQETMTETSFCKLATWQMFWVDPLHKMMPFPCGLGARPLSSHYARVRTP